MKEKLTKTSLMNNLGLKVLALLIAVFTWLVVVNVDDPITTKVYTNISVTVINADEVITDKSRTYEIIDDTDEVTVTIKARRSVLSKIRQEYIHAVADMKELVLGTQIPIEVTVDRVNGRIEEITTKPGNLQVVIDEEETASFPINPSAIGDPRDGYTINSLTVNPVQVTLRGPQGLIQNIHRVAALTDVSGMSESKAVKARLVLYDSYDNVIDQTMIENSLDEDGVIVDVVLDQKKAVPIVTDPSMINVKNGYKLTDVKVTPVNISISGSKSTLKKVSQIKIPAEALEMYGVDQTVEVPIDIAPYLPDNTKLTDENTNIIVVTVTVDPLGAEAYTISTGSIEIQNLKENLEVKYGTSVDVQIQVSGPKETLENLSFTGRVKLDMSDYTQPGSYKLPLQIELPEDCSLVSDVYLGISVDEKSKVAEEKTKQE